MSLVKRRVQATRPKWEVDELALPGEGTCWTRGRIGHVIQRLIGQAVQRGAAGRRRGRRFVDEDVDEQRMAHPPSSTRPARYV